MPSKCHQIVLYDNDFATSVWRLSVLTIPVQPHRQLGYLFFRTDRNCWLTFVLASENSKATHSPVLVCFKNRTLLAPSWCSNWMVNIFFSCRPSLSYSWRWSSTRFRNWTLPGKSWRSWPLPDKTSFLEGVMLVERPSAFEDWLFVTLAVFVCWRGYTTAERPINSVVKNG